MSKLYNYKVGVWPYIFLVTGVTILISIAYAYFAPTNCSTQEESQFACNILDILKSVIVGLWAALFTAILVKFFSPAKKDERLVKVISGSEINKNFDRMLKEKLPSWYFKGNRARYLCSCVLPTLTSEAQKSYHIQGIFIDPSNESACEQFVKYKKDSPDDDEGGEWNIERIQTELLCSIILCGYFSQNHYLTLNIFLSDSFSPVRVDSNGHSAIKTVENKRQPALLIEEPFFYLDWFQREFNTKKLQSKQIYFSTFPELEIENISFNDVKGYLFSVFGENCFSDEVISNSINQAKKNENPYK